jgi:23S rRNA (guanosine2251-2'-O)-methyltransferase
MNEEITAIYGKHAVMEAIKARPDVVRTVFVTGGSDEALVKLLTEAHIQKKDFNPKKLPDGVPSDAVHQGIAAHIDTSKLVISFDEFITLLSITPHTSVAILGEVQDPHNVGAIIRSAAAFGVSAVLIPEHRQAQVNGTVVKVSAGMSFRIPLVSIGNVNQTIAELKEKGFWIYGLDGEAEQSLHDEKFEKPSAFILGNEASGIRLKTLEHCDIPLRIPMHSNAESLNASVAGALVFYAWSRHHGGALK